MDMMIAEGAVPSPEPLGALVGRMLGELGAVAMLPLVRLGDRLGRHAALAEAGPVTPAGLALRAGTQERLTREWLSAHAAAGHLDHDPATGRFAMTPEQRMVFADADSPVFMQGAFEIAEASMADLGQVERGRSAATGAAPAITAAVPACSAAWNASSAPAAAPICSRSGCRRWRAWWRSWNRAARVADIGCGLRPTRRRVPAAPRAAPAPSARRRRG